MGLSVYEELRQMIGMDQPEMVATDDVCKQMIRHWCEAIEDGDPRYTDEEYARRSKHGSIVAPPTMIWSWMIPPRWPPQERPAVYKALFETCARGGFDQVIDTDCDMEFFQPLLPGDRVKAVTKVADVSTEKRTGLGRGHFITIESTYKNQRGELMCIQRIILLMYRAGHND